MRFNNNNGTIDLVPVTLNIVNLQGLKLICRKTSERYERNASKEKDKTRKKQSPDLKNREFRSNKIYFKKKKEKDDQLYFSDYRIKYGSQLSYMSNNRAMKLNSEEKNQPSKPPANPHNDIQNQRIAELPPAENQLTIQDKQSYLLETIKNRERVKRESEKIDEKRHASTKMQKRKTPSFIKVSFSHKNYKKVHLPETKMSVAQTDHKLDGWVVHSPNVYEIDKKLDITSYGEPDIEEARNYFSERKKSNNQNRYFSRIKKSKLLPKT